MLGMTVDAPDFDRLTVRIEPTERPGLCSDLGGAEGNRTPDLLDANESRYQLRHSPVLARHP